MNKITVAIIGAALIGATAAVAAPVFARGDGADHCRHTAFHRGFGMAGDLDGRIERMAHKLGLSKDQVASLRAIADKARPQSRDIRDRMADAHRALDTLRKGINPDETQLSAAADAQGKAIADMIVLQAATRAQIDKVLTPEQLKKWRSHMHHAPWQGRRSES